MCVLMCSGILEGIFTPTYIKLLPNSHYIGKTSAGKWSTSKNGFCPTDSLWFQIIQFYHLYLCNNIMKEKQHVYSVIILYYVTEHELIISW